MTGKDARPLIIIDVNGVLVPGFRCRPPRCRCHPHWAERRIRVRGEEHRVSLNPQHGPALLELARRTGAELAWGTTREEDANLSIGPAIGLPRLPAAPMPGSPGDTGLYEAHGPRFLAKAEGFVPWAQGRPFAWFEDEAEEKAAAAVLASQPHLVIWVDPPWA